MNDTDMITCDGCGLLFPPSHMSDNHIAQVCQPCDDAFHADMPDPEPLSDWELEDWASQYDDDPNPYEGTYSEM